MVLPRRFLSTVMRDEDVGVEAPRQIDRQRQPRQQRHRPLRERPRPYPQRSAQLQRRDHPQRHRLPVQEAVARGRLQRVADGVTEVQDGAPAGLGLVLGHHLGLHAHRARHQLAHQLGRKIRRALLDEVEDGRDRR